VIYVYSHSVLEESSVEIHCIRSW